MNLSSNDPEFRARVDQLLLSDILDQSDREWFEREAALRGMDIYMLSALVFYNQSVLLNAREWAKEHVRK